MRAKSLPRPCTTARPCWPATPLPASSCCARPARKAITWPGARTRLEELGSRPSLLNPLWYAGSFAIGALAAAVSDRLSLGFVVETERQVEGHLASHLQRLPEADERSRAIVRTMQADEAGHAAQAQSAGAAPLPQPVPQIMRAVSKVMTSTAYRV